MSLYPKGFVSLPRLWSWWQRRAPLTLKMLLLASTISGISWAILDQIQDRHIQSLLQNYMLTQLEERSEEDMLILDDYMRAQARTVTLFTQQMELHRHLEQQNLKNWNAQTSVQTLTHNRRPPWLPRISIIRSLTNATHIVLLDATFRVREVFQRDEGKLKISLEKILKKQMSFRDGHNSILILKSQLFLTSTAAIGPHTQSPQGWLLFLSPMNDAFLKAFKRQTRSKGVVAFINSEQTKILTSSNPTLVPHNATLHSLKGLYSIRSQHFDYGFSSDTILHFATLTSWDDINSMSHKILKSARTQKGVSLGVLLLAFSLFLVWISRKLHQLIQRMVRYINQELNQQLPHFLLKGDQLYILQELFSFFLEEIKRFQEDLANELEKRKQSEIELEEHHLDLEVRLDKLVSDRTRMLSRFTKKLQNEIDERKQADAALIRLGAAIEQTADMVMITDVGGIIEYVNPAFVRISGYDREKAIGRKTNLLNSGHQDADFYKQMWATLLKGTIWKGNLVNKTEDGKLINLEETISPIRNASNKITNFVAVIRDTTREFQLEQQLRHSQKMEAIGTLAGGIAHDFNNILGAILSYAELNVDDFPPDNQTHKDMLEIIQATNRGRELIQHLLIFSRREEINRKSISLIPVIKEVMQLLRGGLPTTIEICPHIDHNTPNVSADPTQIHQVLMNLCTNAGHAMGEKVGTLEIRLESKQVEPKDVAQHSTLNIGEYVVITVADSGSGIAQEHLDRIFEPFFSTKKIGEGTGLGLSTVHGIAKSHGGTITVESTLGEGTTFCVFLPRHFE